MKVEGLNRLRTVIQEISDEIKSNQETVVVGYTQNYAIYVHERPTSRRSELAGKSWKYLEQPARGLQSELASIIRTVYKQTGSLVDGLILAGLRLQRESQEMVPIDTGALKASSFTAMEEDMESVSMEAYSASEAVREAAMAARKGEKIAESTRRTLMKSRKAQATSRQKLANQLKANRAKRRARTIRRKK